MQVHQIPVHHLKRGQYQTRKHFDEQALTELAESFREQGIIQPLVVRQLGTKQYEIIAGERRWRAAQLAQFTEVPCLIHRYSDAEAAAVTTIENLQRCDLNAIEEADAFATMIKEFSYQHDELAAIVGKSRAYVTNSLRLLKLEPRVQEMLVDGSLQPGHGKMLAGLEAAEQLQLANRCIEREWSVRKLEQEVRRLAKKSSASGPQHAIGPDIERLEQVLGERIGSEVQFDLKDGSRSGWFKIKFYDPDTLAGVLEKLGLEYEE